MEKSGVGEGHCAKTKQISLLSLDVASKENMALVEHLPECPYMD